MADIVFSPNEALPAPITVMVVMFFSYAEFNRKVHEGREEKISAMQPKVLCGLKH
jgi:hypothetical protein